MSFGLRKITEADLEMLREHRNQPETRCWLGSDEVISQEAQTKWWSSGGAESYRIFFSDGPHGPVDVGLIRVTKVLGRFACVGSDIFKKYRGNGLGKHAFDAARHHALALGADKHWLQVFLQNTRAVRIYMNAGFTFSMDTEIETVTRLLPGARRPYKLHYARMEFAR